MVSADDVSTVRELFVRYHSGDDGIGADELDQALGLEAQAEAVASSYDVSLESRHPGESVVYLPTPYPVCRNFFQAVEAASDDCVLDLGCGLGRLLLYGALVSPARFVGVELVDSRLGWARTAVDRLALDRVDLIAANMRDLSLEQGTIFYVFRPFSEDTERTMLARFHALARRQPFVIGTYRLRPDLFDEALFEHRDLGALSLYRSRHPG